MKKIRVTIAFALLFAMLLPLLSGVAYGAGKTITTGSQLVFDPLSKTQSIAYEKHAEGYEAALSCAEDGVTMDVTAVPSTRTENGAVLYVRTGVSPKAGAIYAVSYSLTAEQAVETYSLCFDGSTENAYGEAETRAASAGSNLVRTFVTAKSAKGELVLRLLLGKTEVNTFRMSDLSVKECTEQELSVGKKTVVADSLNYNTPSAVRYWAADEYGAELTSGEKSVTMTVTKTPEEKEIWKLKLYIATGLFPQPGKAYHFRATVTSSATRKYEICYNEGEVEKGYDVLYDQTLSGGTQVIDRLIYVTRDKQNPGELIAQLSLGLLQVGDKVTVSNIFLQEATATYLNMMPSSFNYANEWEWDDRKPEPHIVEVGTENQANVNWANKTAITRSGDKAGELVVDRTGGTAKLRIVRGANPWDARLNAETGVTLEPNSMYRASITVKSHQTNYSNLEVIFGSAFANDFDILDDYGARKGQQLTAGEEKTFSQSIFTDENAGTLFIQLFAGATGGQDNIIEITGLNVVKLEEQPGHNTPVGVQVTYPGMAYGSFEMRDNKGELTGNGSSATYKCTSESGGGAWERGLFINDVCTLEANEQYKISFSIQADKQTEFEVCYNKDGNWGASEKAFGAEYGLTASTAVKTVEHTFTPEAGGALSIRIDLGKAEQNTSVTVSGVKVEKFSTTATRQSVGTVKYPGESSAQTSFEVRDLNMYDSLGGNPLSGDGSSASFLCSLDSDWQRGFWIHNLATLQEGFEYELSYQIKATKDVSYRICLSKEDDVWGGETYFGKLDSLTKAAGGFTEVKHTIPNQLAGKLSPRFDITAAETDAVVTVKDVKVTAMPSGTVAYPAEEVTGSFEVRDLNAYETLGGNPLSGDGESASFRCSLDSDWQRGFWIHNAAELKENVEYELSYQIKATGTISYRIFGCKEDDVWGGESYFGKIENLQKASGDFTTVTHTIPNKVAGNFSPRFDITAAATDTVVTIKDVKVTVKTENGTITYPTAQKKDSFEVRDLNAYDTLGGNPLSGDGESASFLCSLNSDWQRGFWIHNIAALQAGGEYELSYQIKATKDITYRIFCGKEDDIWGGEAYFGKLENLSLTAGDFTEVKHTIPNSVAGKLTPRFDVTAAATDTVVTIKNVKLTKITQGGSFVAEQIDVQYPSNTETGFEVRDNKGTLSGDGASYAEFTCTTEKGEGWQRGLFVNDLCTLSAGEAYRVSFKIKADQQTSFDVCYNKDGNWGESEKAFGAQYDLTAAGEWSTVDYSIYPASTGTLSIRLDLGRAEQGTVIQVKDFKAERIALLEIGDPITSFGSVWTEQNGCDVELTQDSQSASVKLTPRDGVDKADWRAKLFVDTGVIAKEGKGYRISYDVKSTKSQNTFHVVYGYGGSGIYEKVYGERWEESIRANAVKTITDDVFTRNEPGHPITLMFLLGLVDGTDNTFTISNVRVYECSTVTQLSNAGWGIGASVREDHQPGYTVYAYADETSGTVQIVKTPKTGAEPWKLKMFVETGVRLRPNEWYRVSMDVAAKNEMDYEVCYNADGVEKGFDAYYGLHASAGQTRRVERMFRTDREGQLIIQLSLGGVPAPNTVTVSNVRIENTVLTYTGGSAMPAEPVYDVQSNVTYWAHNDYNVSLTGSDSAITAHIRKAPSFGAEPWKIKLFLDTETPLEAGKFYKVSADFLAKSPQRIEICYNNGFEEMGYDSIGGIQLAAGKKQTVQKLLFVPAGKTDTKNLMLQCNLGAASSPNEIKVSGVSVEEVAPQYVNLMAKGFSYPKNSSVWTADDYAAGLHAGANSAAISVTSVPASGAEVWKAKLFIRTGVYLTPGMSYVVRANLNTAKDLTYELCFNNEETEKGFDVLYGQSAAAGARTPIDKKITVPESMTDAGELVLQFSVGGPSANTVTVSDVAVEEIRYGTTGAKDMTPKAAVSQHGAADLAVTRSAVSGTGSEIRLTGAQLAADEQYQIAFTAKSEGAQQGTLLLRKTGEEAAAAAWDLTLTAQEKQFAFTLDRALAQGGGYELLWQLEGGKKATFSNVRISMPSEKITVKRSTQKLTVNGKAVTCEVYNVNGSNYFKLRDVAMLLNDTDAQFVVRYNAKTKAVALTTGKRYMPVGGELTPGKDLSATCVRSMQNIELDGESVRLKAYKLGGNNYFKIRTLADLLGFSAEYLESTDTVQITSAMTPEAQEASYTYETFFRPEIDSESQPYVGDPMTFYENGTYYIYYLKEGGDSLNHSVYLTTTTDFTTYQEYDRPVLAAARGDEQDSWIGTGSVTKVDGTYYFFYTGHTTSPTYEFGETLLVAKSSNLTSFERVSGWEITPPESLGQKRDFRDPQAYYDPATGKITLTVTASQNGVASVLKYTLDKNLKNAHYDGIIFSDPTRAYWNLECTDTFKIGNTWYLTYSGQEDTLWYAASQSQFGPYSAPVQLDGKVFYAAKHVENGGNCYMVGWARRSETASSTQEVSAWGGNLVVQQVKQLADGSLTLVPVDSIQNSFRHPMDVAEKSVSLSANSEYSYQKLCTAAERFMLTGEFTCGASGTFGLAFDFNGEQSAYKLISVNPSANTVSLSFNEGVTKIAETPAKLGTKHSFTYIQDGSIGIFYVDGAASLVTRVYGSTGKPVYLFAQNGSVSFTSLQAFTN